MKKILILFLSGFLYLGLFSQNEGFRLEITVEGAGPGTGRIIGMLGGQNYLVDSVQIDESGKMVYERDSPLPGGLYYFVYDKTSFIQFLKGDENEIVMKTSDESLLKDMQVEKSLNNRLFYENLKFEQDFKKRFDEIEEEIDNSMIGSDERKKLRKKRDDILKERTDHISHFQEDYPEAFFTKFKIAGQNPDLQYPKKENGDLDTARQVHLYRKMYWDGVDLSDERLLRTPVIPNKLKTYIKDLVPQKTDSLIKYSDFLIDQTLESKEMFKYVANWIAKQYQKPKIMGLDAVYVHLVDKYWTDELAFWATQKQLQKLRKDAADRKVSLLGKTAQNLRAKNPDGEYKELYDLEGPVRILYMYSYSCSHCRERTPVLKEEVWDKWKDKGLQIYAFNLDDNEEKWKKFIEKHDIHEWVNVIDPMYESGYYKKYHIDVTPEVYVMDENWKIISKDLHPNQLEPTLKKYLGGNQK